MASTDMATERDMQMENEYFALICAFISGKCSTLANFDPHSCRENWNLYCLMKKYNIKLDDSLETPGVPIRQFVAGAPLYVANVLRRRSGKIAEIYGNLRGLPHCLAFPWGINMIPTTPEWEALTVLWKMWKESYSSNIIRRGSKGEYMQLSYFSSQELHNREDVMTWLGLQPPPSKYAVRKIDSTLEQYGYGDNYTAFEIIFASSAPDIWQFYETHSGTYSFVDFSRCPEVTSSGTTDSGSPAASQGYSVTSQASNTHSAIREPSACKSDSGLEQQKPKASITTVCFNGFNELKNLIDSLEKGIEQKDSKMNASTREKANSDNLAKDSDHQKSAGKTNSAHILSDHNDAGKKNQTGSASTPNRGAVVIRARETCCEKEPQNLTVRTEEVSDKSGGEKNSDNDSRSFNSESWEYVIMKETTILASNDPRKFSGQPNVSVRAGVIRDILRKYLIQNPNPTRFTCVSPSSLVFPELPILESCSLQDHSCKNMSVSHLNQIPDLGLINGSLPKSVEEKEDEMSSSNNSVTGKREEMAADHVFIKPKPPPRARVSRKRPFETESSAKQKRQEEAKNIHTRGILEDTVSINVGDMTTNEESDCSNHAAEKTDPLVIGLVTKPSEVVCSQSSPNLGDEAPNKETVRKHRTRNSSPQQTSVQQKSDAKVNNYLSRGENVANVRSISSNCRQETKDRDQRFVDLSTINNSNDTLQTNSTYRAFKVGSSGDGVATPETENVPVGLISKNIDLQCHPFPENKTVVDVTGNQRVTNGQKEMALKSKEITNVTSLPSSRTRSTFKEFASKPFEIVNEMFNPRAEGYLIESVLAKYGGMQNKEYVTPSEAESCSKSVPRSKKRLNDCDEPKNSFFEDDFLSSQRHRFRTFGDRNTSLPPGDRKILWAIKKFLPPPRITSSGERRISKQIRNVIKARTQK